MNRYLTCGVILSALSVAMVGPASAQGSGAPSRPTFDLSAPLMGAQDIGPEEASGSMLASPPPAALRGAGTASEPRAPAMAARGAVVHPASRCVLTYYVTHPERGSVTLPGVTITGDLGGQVPLPLAVSGDCTGLTVNAE